MRLKEEVVTELENIKKNNVMSFNKYNLSRLVSLNYLDEMLDFFCLSFFNGYHITISCWLRIVQKNKIILTSADDCFTTNYEEILGIPEGNEVNDKKNLLNKNIKKINKLMKNLMVIEVIVSEVGDVVIKLENFVEIQIFIDANILGEYYRIIRNNGSYLSVQNVKGKLQTKKEMEWV